MSVNYRVRVALNRLSTSLTDVTSKCLDIRTQLGVPVNEHCQRVDGGFAVITLFDDAADSIKAGVERGCKVEIAAMHDGVTWETLWTGHVYQHEPRPDGRVILTCYNAVHQWEQNVDIALMLDVTLDEVASAVHDEVQYLQEYASDSFKLDDGQLDVDGLGDAAPITYASQTSLITVSYAGDWGGDKDITAWDVMAEIAQTDGGLMFADESNIVQFYTRLYADQPELNGIGGFSPAIDGGHVVDYHYDRYINYVTHAEVSYVPRSVGEVRETLWQNANRIHLDTDEILRFNVIFRDENGNQAGGMSPAIEAFQAWGELGGLPIDVTGACPIAIVREYGGGVKIRIKNESGAACYVETLKIDGFMLRRGDPVVVSVANEERAALYGKRQRRIALWMLDDEAEAIQAAENMLGFGILKPSAAQWVEVDAQRRPSVIDVKCGDLGEFDIEYVGVGLFYVRMVNHMINLRSGQHRCRLGLFPSAAVL